MIITSVLFVWSADSRVCSQGFQGFGFGDGGFQMSFGIGAFPFGIFATAFNINDGRPPPGVC